MSQVFLKEGCLLEGKSKDNHWEAWWDQEKEEGRSCEGSYGEKIIQVFHFGFESLLQKSVFPNSSLPVIPWVSLNHICLTEWQKQLVITASTVQLTTLGKWELHSGMSCAASTIATQVLIWDPFYQRMTKDGQVTQLGLLAAGWVCDPGSAESQNKPPALLPSREMLAGKNPSTVSRPHTAGILSMLKSINQTSKVMCYIKVACQY